jgi:hypothetical protein
VLHIKGGDPVIQMQLFLVSWLLGKLLVHPFTALTGLVQIHFLI